MIIAVKRYYSWSVALCEEVRRTDKRIYVRLVEGDSNVVSGRNPNWYVDTDQVINDQATRDQFKVIRVAVANHNNAMQALEHQIRIGREMFARELRESIK